MDVAVAAGQHDTLDDDDTTAAVACVVNGNVSNACVTRGRLGLNLGDIVCVCVCAWVAIVREL